MPLKMKPVQGEPTVYKRVTPDGLETEGPYAEWFEIENYIDTKVVDDAKAAATTSIVKKNQTFETLDRIAFWRNLMAKKVHNWRLIVAPDIAFNKVTMEVEDGIWFWKFLPETMATLPDDVCMYVAGEILSCGGIVPTEGLLVKTDSGQVLNYFRQDAGVVAGKS